jgi:two-component system LytT family response regulator
MNLTAPLRVIIVEDMISIQQDVEDFLKQQPDFTVIGACSTVQDAIVLMHATKPDLLLLDIGLPDGTGFDILEQMSTHVKVIFLTAYDQYAIPAIRYGAIDYLLKPLDKNELRVALQRAINAQPLLQEQIDITLHSYNKKKVQDRIALQCAQFVEIVEIKEISYLQSDNGNTSVFLNNGKKVVSIMTLTQCEELLPETSFLRTHQSYLVNKIYIHRYHWKEGKLSLKNGTQIPVSNRKKETVNIHFKTL